MLVANVLNSDASSVLMLNWGFGENQELLRQMAHHHSWFVFDPLSLLGGFHEARWNMF
jgi:hypothetical protein